MADFPWIKWYPRDYIADTRHLTPAQRGCYSDLLNYLFLQHGHLPDDDIHLSRMCGIDVSNWRRWIRPGIENLFTIEDGKWSHSRVLDSLDRAHRTAQARKSSGRVGGEAKAQKIKETALANATNLLQQKSSKALARTESESESDIEKKDTPPLSPPEGTKKQRKRSWHDGVILTPELREYAEGKVAGCDPDEMWTQFENHHRAKGSMFVDWNRAWFTWVNSPYEKPMNGGQNERPCGISPTGAKPGGKHQRTGSFVEASRAVLALRSRTP